MKFILCYSFGIIILAIIVQFNKQYQHPTADVFLQTQTVVPSNIILRMMACILPQFLGWNPVSNVDSSTTNSLQGQSILITGGTRGIGYEISKGLVRANAQEVIMISRNAKIGNGAKKTLEEEVVHNNNQEVQFYPVDLSDLDSVHQFVQQMKQQDNVPQQPLDQVILNAGYWPTKYYTSKQGYEITYATNVLGPHLLLRLLIKEDLLKINAKVIITVGELYITLSGTENLGCSSNFTYDGDGEIAYCRSKLGLMTLFDQYLERLPSTLQFVMVHPGVIDNGLVNAGQGNDMLPKPLLINNEEGAQTTLILATASNVERGSYYHNCLGKLILPEDDPAKNITLGNEMWDLAEQLIQDYM